MKWRRRRVCGIISFMTKVNQFKLSNGLPVIFIQMPEVPSAAIGFMTKVGERDGGMAKAGISHLLEHLLFDGTAKFPDRTDLSIALDEIGAEFNGETSEESTYYYLKCEPKSFSRGVFILGQMVTKSLLKEKELAKEKLVISQELNMREDDPMIKTLDYLQETLFPNHPLGCSREAAIKAMPGFTRENLLDHWQNNYRSGSSVLAICGDRKKLGKIKNICEENFGVLGQGEREKLEPVNSEKPGEMKVIKRKMSQVNLGLGIRGFPLTDPRIYAGKLLDIIFGHSFSSRLFMEIREKRKLAYAVFSGIDFYQDAGTFSVFAGVDNKRLEEAVKAVIEEMKKITQDKKEGIAERELSKAKSFLRGKTAVQMDDPSTQAAYYAKRFLFDREIIAPEELIKRYEKVKREELVEVARDLFRPEKINLVAMGEKINKLNLEKLIY